MKVNTFALFNNAVAVLGDETLKAIASDLVVQTIRRSVTINWMVKESIVMLMVGN